MSLLRLRHLVQVNPLTPAFDRLGSEDELTFLPMESVWPGSRLNILRRRTKSAVITGYTRFQDGDVLVPKITPTFEAGRSVLIRGLHGGVGAGTTELHILRPGPRIDPRFLLYVVNTHSFLKLGKAEMYGVAGQQRVPDDFLRNLPVQLPRLEEQRRIADFLDAETARIDKLSRLNAELISLLYERHRAVIDDETETASDTSVKLFWHLSVLRDGTHQPPPRVALGVPLLTARNISSGVLQLTDMDTSVSEESADDLDRSLKLTAGDVLLSVKGTIGACAVTPPNFPRVVLDRNVALLRPRVGFSSEWLAFVLKSTRLQEQMRMSVTAAAQPGLPLGAIRELRVPDLDPSAQPARAMRMTVQCQETDDVIRRVQAKDTLLAERRQALITAAVIGQIDVSTASGRGIED